MMHLRILLLLVGSASHDKLYRVPVRGSLIAEQKKISDHAGHLVEMLMALHSSGDEASVVWLYHYADLAIYEIGRLVSLTDIYKDMGTEHDRKIVLKVLRGTIELVVNDIERSLVTIDQQLILMKVNARTLSDDLSILANARIAGGQKLRDDVHELEAILDIE